MRTIIDLQEEQVALLAEECSKKGVSRASVIRDAVAQYLCNRPESSIEKAFGILSQGKPASKLKDGLLIQDELRDEWER